MSDKPDLRLDDAINALSVFTSMEDAQLALNCERIIRAEIERLNAALRDAREALKPFAATAAVLRDTKDSAIWAGQIPAPPITFGHLRAAERLYAALQPKEPQ